MAEAARAPPPPTTPNCVAAVSTTIKVATSQRPAPALWIQKKSPTYYKDKPPYKKKRIYLWYKSKKIIRMNNDNLNRTEDCSQNVEFKVERRSNWLVGLSHRRPLNGLSQSLMSRRLLFSNLNTFLFLFPLALNLFLMSCFIHPLFDDRISTYVIIWYFALFSYYITPAPCILV
mgnify:CR=1 FL=1